MIKEIYRKLKKSAQKYLPGYYLVDKYKIYIKYLMSGGAAATTDLGLLYIFTEELGLWYLFSAVFAFSIAFFVSFFLQKFWTFRDTDLKEMRKQMGVYLTVALINLAVNSAGIFLLVEKFGMW